MRDVRMLLAALLVPATVLAVVLTTAAWLLHRL
jgi:hypothetical protein